MRYQQQQATVTRARHAANLHGFPDQTLVQILLLLVIQHTSIEIVLQSLIAEVDTKLLKAVAFEVLEPKHVQNPNPIQAGIAHLIKTMGDCIYTLHIQ